MVQIDADTIETQKDGDPKITVQMRLPSEVLARLQREAERDMIPQSYLVRRCVLRFYSGDSFVPDDRINPTVAVETVHHVDG